MGQSVVCAGVAAAILAVTALLLVYIRRGEAEAPSSAAPAAAMLAAPGNFTCVGLSNILDGEQGRSAVV